MSVQSFAITVYNGAADGMPDRTLAGHYFIDSNTVFLCDAFGKPFRGQHRKLYRGDSAERIARELWGAKFGGGARDLRDAEKLPYPDPRTVAPA